MCISRKLALCLCVVVGVMVCVVAAPAGAKPVTGPATHFGIVPGSFHMAPSSDQAGAHANLTTEFEFASNARGETDGDVRNIVVNLPAGFDASDTAVPTCSDAQLLEGQGTQLQLPNCPAASAVGHVTLDLSGEKDEVPVYNMQVTSFGVAAQLGFIIATNPYVITVQVRPGDTGLTTTSPDIETNIELSSISITIWGVPAAAEHDTERVQVCKGTTELVCEFSETPQQTREDLEEHVAIKYGPVSANVPVKPFLSNPTSCGAFTAAISAIRGRNREGSLQRAPKSARSPNANACRLTPRSKCSPLRLPRNRPPGWKCLWLCRRVGNSR